MNSSFTSMTTSSIEAYIYWSNILFGGNSKTCLGNLKASIRILRMPTFLAEWDQKYIELGFLLTLVSGSKLDVLNFRYQYQYFYSELWITPTVAFAKLYMQNYWYTISCVSTMQVFLAPKKAIWINCLVKFDKHYGGKKPQKK